MQKPELWDIFQGKLLTECGISPIERSVFQSTERKGAADLKSAFCVRHGDSETGVCQNGFWSCFNSDFPHYAPYPTIAVCILCH